MKSRFSFTVVIAVSLALSIVAAEEPVRRTKMQEVLRAAAADEAKRPAAQPAAGKSAGKADSGGPAKAGAAPISPPGAAPETTATAPKEGPATRSSAAAKPADEPATVLPRVEVRKDRITEVDREIYLQEKEIAREKRNTQQSEVDKALNSPKVSAALGIFGGESSAHRAGVASERVSLMQEEKDLLEQMRHAKTKEEKAELQKQIDELKAYRRELEKALR